MKLMIASDIHGSAYYLDLLLKCFEEENPDRLLLLGDILYHGPRNDLPEGYKPKEVAKRLNNIKNSLLCVRGNCDSEVDQMMLEFPILADYAYISADGLDIFATHGHIFNKASLPPLKPDDILLHGHTHVTAFEKFGEKNYYINPGSVSIPKENTKRGYLILEQGAFTFKDLSGKAYKTEKIK